MNWLTQALENGAVLVFDPHGLPQEVVDLVEESGISQDDVDFYAITNVDAAEWLEDYSKPTKRRSRALEIIMRQYLNYDSYDWAGCGNIGVVAGYHA